MMVEKSKYPPVNKPEDIKDNVRRFEAMQRERIIELLQKILRELE